MVVETSLWIATGQVDSSSRVLHLQSSRPCSLHCRPYFGAETLGRRELSDIMKGFTFLAVALSAATTDAFTAPAPRQPARAVSPSSTRIYESTVPANLAEQAKEISDEPLMNPDNPNLPALKGDYDWDAEYAADDDWITENVPGKIVVNEVDLAAQVTELTKIEDKYRKIRKAQEYEDARIIGFVPQAEMYNGRAAMFFLVVGLLTELWTGISIPGQIEEMARVGGFIGPDF